MVQLARERRQADNRKAMVAEGIERLTWTVGGHGIKAEQNHARMHACVLLSVLHIKRDTEVD